MVGSFGQMFAVQRHYISYADLLKIRYANFPCLIMVGTEDRLVREANSYMLKRVGRPDSCTEWNLVEVIL
jgi:hypothetical protein